MIASPTCTDYSAFVRSGLWRQASHDPRLRGPHGTVDRQKRCDRRACSMTSRHRTHMACRQVLQDGIQSRTVPLICGEAESRVLVTLTDQLNAKLGLSLLTAHPSLQAHLCAAPRDVEGGVRRVVLGEAEGQWSGGASRRA